MQHDNILKRFFEFSPNLICITGLKGDFKYINTQWEKFSGYSREELLSKSFKDIILPQDYKKYDDILKNISEQKTIDFENRYISKDKSIKYIQWSVTPMPKEKVLYCIGYDITERKLIEEALVASQNQLEAVARIGSLTNSSLNLNEVLNFILTGTLQVVNASVGMIFIRDLETGNLSWGASCGLSDAFVNSYKERIISSGEGLTGRIAQTGEPIFIQEDSSKDSRIVRPVIYSENLNSFIGIPIYAENEIVAVMNILTRPPEILKEEDVALIKAVGTHVGFAIRNAKIFKERKQAEEKLRESELKFSKAFYNQPIAKQIINLDNGIRLEVNEEFCKLSGYSKEELTKISAYKKNLWKDHEQQKKIVEKLISNKHTSDYPMEIIAKSGEIRNLLLNAALLEIEDSNIAIASFLDITDVKIANKELKLHNRYLEALTIILQNSFSKVAEMLDYTLKQAINITESKIGSIYFYNEEKKQFTLNSRSGELMKTCGVKNQQTIYDLNKMGCLGESVRQRKPFIINDYSKEKKYAKGIPKGHIKLIKFLSVPVIVQNEIKAVISVANRGSDYTNREVKQLTLLMEAVWKIIQQKQYETNLIIAKEKAEDSDRLKTEFINNLSHEIRTPMNGIIGFSEILSKLDKIDGKGKNYIKIIQNSGNQLMRIIDDILEISKLETKQVKVIERQVCLNDFLLQLFSIFDIKAKELKIPLYFKKGLSDNDSIILTDETKLNKIISNLLENALKFTNTGFIEIGYLIVNNELEIYVKDTGIGIKPENQASIFDRFSQEEKSLSQKVGGLGLGLSIAKANTELLGGKITLKSQKGEGSTFFVTIPYKPVRIEPKRSKFYNNKGKTEDNPNKYTILIVEDEEINYLYLEALIEDKIELDCKLLHAKDGKEAVGLCKDNIDIDFVLMDLKMSQMNGYEATKQIRKFRNDLPIVAQTAYSTNEDIDKAISAGCNDFISKPISEETLFKTINKYLKLEK